MLMSSGWTFLVELAGDPPHLSATKGLCLVDLSSCDDRGDVEPYVDEDGALHCALGRKSDDVDEEKKRLEIVGAWEYRGGEPFNEKFLFFRPASLVHFVRRFCRAAQFDDASEVEIMGLMSRYGVLRPVDTQGLERG